jgi:hypothetical protein
MRCPLATALGLLAFAAPTCALAQGAAPEITAPPFRIVDNSFFIEEAFNQEPGVFQNIFAFVRAEGGGWELGFTQEWPVGTQRHQLSYTVPITGGDGSSGVGHVFLHYRLQALTETRSRPAFSPRLSLVLPTGDEPAGFGDGRVGVQANLPFSKQIGDVYAHWNAGITYHPHEQVDELTPSLGASLIWRARPMIHLLVETLALFEELDGPAGEVRETAWLVSPGVRAGWNLGDHQLVLGGAVAIGLTDATDDTALFAYLSYELPFRR